jgi:hypothetical protein
LAIGKRASLFILAAILIVTTIFYARVLNFDYTNYDDGSFTADLAVLSFDLPTIFIRPAAFDYIPVTLTSYAVENAIFGFNPHISHTVNLLLHLLNIVLLFVLLLKLTSDEVFSLVVAFIFALHPMNVESVAWFSERKGLLSTAFTILSVLQYLKFTQDTQKKGNLFASFLFYTLAVLSKPVALPLPALLLAFELWRRNWRRVLWLGPFFAVAFGLAVIHAYVRNSIQVAGLLGVEQLLKIPYTAWFYVVNFFIPKSLSAFYTEAASLKVFSLSPSVILFIVGIILLCVKIPKIRSGILWALFVYVLFIIPQSKVLPYGLNFQYSDRYFYLAGIGIIILFAVVLETALKSRFKLPAFALFAIFQISLLGVTWQRISIWQNSETLWSSVVKNDPHNALAYNNLGLYYFDNDDLPQAEKSFLESSRTDLHYSKPLVNLAALYEKRGDYPKVLYYIEQALVLEPENAQLRYAQAQIQRLLEAKK